MGYYRFVKEDSIHHSKEVVMSYINKLKPLKYNRFLWWKTHTDGIEPLGKRAPLKDRILNGDFNPSTYYWQAQLSLYTAKEKLDLRKDDTQYQVEKLQLDLARYRRLMDDFEKEEPARLNSLYDAFTSSFQITREHLQEELLDWPGDIIGFYNYCLLKYNTTSSANRKNEKKRGRPKKISYVIQNEI
jgi:hypothetical protein